MGALCTQAQFLGGKPAQLRSTSKSLVCARCEESGLSPHGNRALYKEPLETAPKGEEKKVRAYKDGLTVQLYLRNGPFWDAVETLRKKRSITAERQMPPSEPKGNDLIMPDEPFTEGQDFFERYDEWLADLQEIEKRCVPARLWGAADWKAFISACVLCDPPEDRDQLDVFARYGDLRFFDYDPGKGDRAPMQAAAPIRRMVTDEKYLEEVHLWLLNRLIEEIGKRYLAPAGVDVEEAVEDIINSTNLNNEYHAKRLGLRREWHLIAADGVTADDVRKAASMLSSVREARSSGGRAPRNHLTALQCALLYDAPTPSVSDLPKSERRRILAVRYSISENEVDKYVELGRGLISEARQD